MTEVRFYHLTTTPMEQALPQILGKAYQSGARIVVRTRDERQAEQLADHLWTHDPNQFLPHGTKVDGQGERQPIWLTAADDVPNGATIALTVCGGWPAGLEQFTLACDIFDGRDDAAVQAARGRWKDCKDAGHTLTYWQQTDNGWEKKA